MAGIGKTAHVGPDLGYDHFRHPLVNPGNPVQQLDLFLLWGDPLGDLSVQFGNLLLQQIHVREQLGQHQPVMGLDLALQSFL